MNKSKQKVIMIINYYTGEKWYLIEKDGQEVYVNELEYEANQTDSQRPAPKVQEVPED